MRGERPFLDALAESYGTGMRQVELSLNAAMGTADRLHRVGVAAPLAVGACEVELDRREDLAQLHQPSIVGAVSRSFLPIAADFT